MGVEEYIEERQKYEEYAFSLEELLRKTDKTEVGAKRELARLASKKKVVNLRRGFYLILPPRYAALAKLPVQLYIEKLFKYLDKKYYLALYSAARLHGASHQQLQKDYIITEPPALLNIEKGATSLRFLTASNWPQGNLVQKKGDSGYFQVSSPALTAIDLVHYHSKLGGLSRVFTVLEELMEEVSEADVQSLLDWYGNTGSLQRWGYLLDALGQQNALADMLHAHLSVKDIHPVLLSPRPSEKPGSANNRWKIDANVTFESDL